jgi:di/tricarboxylate transporter
VGLISGFMNNTTVTAMFMGPIIRLARQAKVSPSRLLMPLAFASIMGGTCTLIGTSTNVAVSGYLRENGYEPLGMFEFFGVGLIIFAAGIGYMLLVGRHLLPDRRDASDDVTMRQYFAEVEILPGSPLIGQEVFKSDFSVLDFQVIKIERGGVTRHPAPREQFEEGDVVQVAGRVENLIRVKKIEGIDIVEDATLRRKLGDDAVRAHIAEIVLMPKSPLIGDTLKRSNFRQASGVSVLALMRGDRSITRGIGDTELKAGDLMLVQGPFERIRRFEEDAEMVVITDHQQDSAGLKRGLIVLSFFVLAIAASSIGWLSAPLAMLMTALLAIVMKTVSVETAYENIDWRLLVLIAGMTAFGHAMVTSGAAELVSGAVVGLLQPIGPMAVLAGFAVLAMVLTQQMSNAAAALVVLPVAMEAAASMGLSERTFAITVMLSASLAVVTPFEPSCLLVYGPGKYRFTDYLRVGGGLAVIMLVLILWLVPKHWPMS